jgi:Site-specific recombinases, DNA invertase Pin homologs
MIDGVAIIERINARGALVKVLDKPHLDLTTLLGRAFLAFLSAMAEDERQRIVKRAKCATSSSVSHGQGRRQAEAPHQDKPEVSRRVPLRVGHADK